MDSTKKRAREEPTELLRLESRCGHPDDAMDHQEQPPLESYEAEQAVRNTRYCTFDPEGPEDYTDGPCRWTIGNDGVKNCGTLLLPYHLSKQLQDAALQQRRYTRKERQINAQRAEIRRLQSTAKAEISVHKFRIEDEQQSDQQEDEDGINAMTRLTHELQILEAMLEESTQRQKELEMTLQELGDYPREAYTDVMLEIDEAFTLAHLIEAQDHEDLPVERVVLQEHPQLPLPNNKRISALQQAAQQALSRFESARREFDLRALKQERERAFNKDAWLHGTHAVDVDTAAFDARWLWLNHTITRELIEAEEGVRAARKKAKAGGIDVLSLAPFFVPVRRVRKSSARWKVLVGE
ncbi:hypothetical protein BST61_g4521 [Cercospora zeina]